MHWQGLVDVAGMAQVAAAVASALGAGDVVLLEGTLGAGKTTWVRYLVAALGGDPALVSSPTYTLLHVYDHAQPAVVHVDAYRLHSADELSGLGFDELAEAAVACIEWPQRVAGAWAVASVWRLVLEHADGQRLVTVFPPTVQDIPSALRAIAQGPVEGGATVGQPHINAQSGSGNHLS